MPLVVTSRADDCKQTVPQRKLVEPACGYHRVAAIHEVC